MRSRSGAAVWLCALALVVQVPSAEARGRRGRFGEEKPPADAPSQKEPPSGEALAKEGLRLLGENALSEVLPLFEQGLLDFLAARPDAVCHWAIVLREDAARVGWAWRGDLETVNQLLEGLDRAAQAAAGAKPDQGLPLEARARVRLARGAIYRAAGQRAEVSSWRDAAGFAREAARREPAQSERFLAVAADALQALAPSDPQHADEVLQEAEEIVQDLRRKNSKDPALRDLHARVLLARARHLESLGRMPPAQSAFRKALALLEPAGEPESGPASDAATWNALLAYGKRNGLLGAKETFVGRDGTSPWFEVRYPAASDWFFTLAMEGGAVFRLRKTFPEGREIEIVMRRWEWVRNYDYKGAKSGGDNRSGVLRLEARMRKDELTGEVATKSLSDRALAHVPSAVDGVLFEAQDQGRRTRIWIYAFKGRMTQNTWTLTITASGQAVPEEAELDPEVAYIVSTLREKEAFQKK